MLPIAALANKKFTKNFCNFSWSVQLSADCFDFIICSVQKGRSSSKWVARPIYEAKNYSWKFDLMAKVTLQLSTLLYTLILIDIESHTAKVDFSWELKNAEHL